MGAVKSVIALWVALVASGLVLAFAARGAGPLPGDLALARLIQQPASDGFVRSLLARVGDLVWLLPPLAILVTLVRRRWLDAFFVFLSVSTGVLISDGIKLLVERSRPSAELVQAVGSPEGYGFPSSTAFLSVVFLGVVGYLIWRAWSRRLVTVVMLVISPPLILSIGISRVYTGEHWPSDVLGGWLLGGAWLLVLVAAHRRWLSGRTKAGDPTARRRTPAPR